MCQTLSFTLVLVGSTATACEPDEIERGETPPPEPGSLSVASTNFELVDEYASLGDDAIHGYLLGQPDDSGGTRCITDLLKYPASAWIVDVPVPDDSEVYGPASGLSLPVASFVVYPSRSADSAQNYEFPYHDGSYGVFEAMLAPGEEPEFAIENERYPLIILAHGAQAHGICDVRHAQELALHGYIVAVINYGDERTAVPDTLSKHVAFMRPLITTAVLDLLLASEEFGGHIDEAAIGITGHSFGGSAVLAVSGGQFFGNAKSEFDERITAGVATSPWVEGRHDGNDFFVFGPENRSLKQVDVPILGTFGTRDRATPAPEILSAMRKVSGPTCVVEFVDQPHVYEDGSWQDRNNREVLFYAAHLKKDAVALTVLANGHSMQGGNEDRQLFDYQRLPAAHPVRHESLSSK